MKGDCFNGIWIIFRMQFDSIANWITAISVFGTLIVSWISYRILRIQSKFIEPVVEISIKEKGNEIVKLQLTILDPDKDRFTISSIKGSLWSGVEFAEIASKPVDSGGRNVIGPGSWQPNLQYIGEHKHSVGFYIKKKNQKYLKIKVRMENRNDRKFAFQKEMLIKN